MLQDHTYLCITSHLESITVDKVMMAPTFMMLIVCLAIIDSKITCKTLCKSLHSLDAFIAKAAYDVDKIHLYFYSNYNQLIEMKKSLMTHTLFFLTFTSVS